MEFLLNSLPPKGSYSEVFCGSAKCQGQLKPNIKKLPSIFNIRIREKAQKGTKQGTGNAAGSVLEKNRDSPGQQQIRAAPGDTHLSCACMTSTPYLLFQSSNHI